MVPSYAELVSDLLGRMIEKSGAVAWQSDNETRTQLVNAAKQMAAEILYGTSGEAMAVNFYYQTGTSIVFGSEVGDDVAWSSESIADAAGRQSAFHDQGADATARPHHWRYRIYTQLQATPTVGNSVRFLLKTSDGTHPDNDDGTGDAAISSINKLKNLTELRSIIVDEAAANIEMVSQGMILIPARYFGIAMWNTAGSATTADAAETKAIFTPVFLQSQ